MSREHEISYTFTEKEIKSLVLLLRRNEAVLDRELDGLRDFMENAVYQSMTIAEAEDFFK